MACAERGAIVTRMPASWAGWAFNDGVSEGSRGRIKTLLPPDQWAVTEMSCERDRQEVEQPSPAHAHVCAEDPGHILPKGAS